MSSSANVRKKVSLQDCYVVLTRTATAYSVPAVQHLLLSIEQALFCGLKLHGLVFPGGLMSATLV